MRTISIDMRMLRNSGIGTYIQNVVPRITSRLPDARFNLMGKVEEIADHAWSKQDNVHIIDCRSPIYSIHEQLELSAKIPKDTDLFWSPHYNIPLLYRKRLMVTVHDLFHLAMPQYVGGIHKRLYAKLMFACLKHRAHAILCDSNFTASELTRLTGANPGKTSVIHLGVGSEWLNCRKVQNPHPKPYLLYVGNVKPNKNLVALLAAFEGISDRLPHDLIIIGKKEGFITGDEQVAEKASALGDRVCFTGYLEFGVMQQYYLHADCMVFPSLYEGFGLPPIEAMACGCPVIVSNAASLPEVCGDAALYCDPHSPEDIASKISQLIDDPSLQDDLRRKGLERAALYSWDKTAKMTMEVLQEALDK